MLRNIIFLSICTTVLTQKLPDIPCPDVFQYIQENGMYYGQIKLPSDHTGVYNMEVNVSMAEILQDVNVGIALTTPIASLFNGGDPVYKISFPTQNVIPKVTEITFNGKVYCSGPGEALTAAGLTALWASHKLKTKIISTSANTPSNKPDIVYPTQPIPNEIEKTPPKVNIIPVPPPPQVPSVPQAPAVPQTQPVVIKQQVEIPKPNPMVANPPEPPKTPKGNFAIRERMDMDCGVFSQPLLNVGTAIKEGEYPWLVAVFQRINLNYKYRCVGNLISDRHVISAGHCYKFQNFDFDKTDFTLVFGKLDLTHWPIGSVLRGIEKLQVHENYKHNSGEYDIALLTLNKPIEFSAFIKPVCLWPDNIKANLIGKKATLVGWGSENNTTHSQIAKRTNLKIASSTECNNSHWTVSILSSSQTLCTRGPGVGPCNGDSGAGLILQIGGKWTLRGVVSQVYEADGKVFCNIGNHTVFSDVSKYTDWIVNNISH